jgi:porphobilinogen synthase
LTMTRSTQFPATRLRRLRRDDFTRRLVREHSLTVDDLIYPIFVLDGDRHRESIASMPGVERLSLDLLLPVAERCVKLGIPVMALFPVIDASLKTPDGQEAKNPEGLVPRVVRALKKEFPDLGVLTDVALDPFTSHGQDGLLDDTGYILNDPTVDVLVQQALVQADAGVDFVAPSDMMDGRIGAIRAALDSNGLERTVLMSYAAKFHSSFYGPFRVAADSAPKTASGLTDRASYQIDPSRAGDALLSVERDVAEGADILMVKPGMPYLDILADLSRQFAQPWAVYEVSGEYAGIELLADQGLANRVNAHREAWTGFVRAGASMIISYGARHAKEWLAS